jgi:beta-lactamase class A
MWGNIMRTSRPTLAFLAVALVGLGGQRPASAQSDRGLQPLEAEIARLAELSGGFVGVGAVHLESGREVYHNAGEPFPMASTYKVPIAVQLLTRVDRGEVRLDSLIEVEPADLHPGSGTLSALFDDPGVILSLRNYLELMLLISDNSATDITLRTAGGGMAVTERMRALGIDGIRVDRPTIELIADWLGIRLPPRAAWTQALFTQLYEATTSEQRDSAEAVFDADPRDTATPDGMALLLARLWRGEILSDSSSSLLLDIMQRSTTGTNRLKGLLTADAEVAHKTGTIGGTTNDVGIITLPGSAGHVVTVVFIKQSNLEVPERERVIAHIARAVHDYFLFNPDGM